MHTPGEDDSHRGFETEQDFQQVDTEQPSGKEHNRTASSTDPIDNEAVQRSQASV